MATTPCPQCHADVPVHDQAVACPSCGLLVDFIDVPEQPCRRCGGLVAEHGAPPWRCTSCKAPHAPDGVPVQVLATCPRCRRDVDVGLDDPDGTCPHCGQAFALSDAP